jgi:hypothetical protein
MARNRRLGTFREAQFVLAFVIVSYGLWQLVLCVGRYAVGIVLERTDGSSPRSILQELKLSVGEARCISIPTSSTGISACVQRVGLTGECASSQGEA